MNLSKELEVNPSSAEAFYFRGLMKSKLKDYEGEIDLNKAKELGSEVAKNIKSIFGK